MKYFKLTSKYDPEDVLYLSSTFDRDTPEAMQERLNLGRYEFQECSEREFKVATDDQNDFVINVGESRFAMEPYESAHSEKEGRERVDELHKSFKCVELVYMPQDNIDINEVVYSWYED